MFLISWVDCTETKIALKRNILITDTWIRCTVMNMFCSGITATNKFAVMYFVLLFCQNVWSFIKAVSQFPIQNVELENSSETPKNSTLPMPIYRVIRSRFENVKNARRSPVWADVPRRNLAKRSVAFLHRQACNQHRFQSPNITRLAISMVNVDSIALLSILASHRRNFIMRINC